VRLPDYPPFLGPIIARWRSPHDEPTAAHYLVMSVGVGVVLASVTLTAPGVGHQLAGSMCASSAACLGPVIPRVPIGSCRVITHADTVTDDAVVFSDDLGHSGRLTLSRTIDKFAIVHWFVRHDGATATGARPQVRDLIGDDGGRLTEFASEDAARQHVAAWEHEPVKRSLAGMDAAGALPLVGDRIDGHRLEGLPADAYLVDGADGLDLSGETRAAMDGPLVPQAVEGLSEVKLTERPDGAGTAVTYRLAPSVASLLGLLAPDGSVDGGFGPGRIVVTLTSDAAGRPARIALEAAGALPSTLNQSRVASVPGTAGSRLSGLLPPLGKLASTAPSLDSFAGRVTLAVNLSSPATLRTVADALHALGVPLLLGDGNGSWSTPPAAKPTKAGPRTKARPRTTPVKATKPSPAAAAAAGAAAAAAKKKLSAAAAAAIAARSRGALQNLYALFDTGPAGTSVTVNTYRTDGLQNARPSITLGLQGGLTFTDSLPADDYYYAAGQGFVKWQECSR
jgi:hypothetical protein